MHSTLKYLKHLVIMNEGSIKFTVSRPVWLASTVPLVLGPARRTSMPVESTESYHSIYNWQFLHPQVAIVSICPYVKLQPSRTERWLPNHGPQLKICIGIWERSQFIDGMINEPTGMCT